MYLPYKPQFDTYVKKTGCPLSMYHFSNIIAWADFFRFEFEVIEDCLCVFAYQGMDSFLYLPPLGENASASVIKECFHRMGKQPIARIENISQNQLPGYPDGHYNQYLKAHDYVYERQALQDLSGNAYKSQRHDVHVFLKNNPTAQYRDFLPSDQLKCLMLYETWAQDRREKHDDPVYQQMLEENDQVHATLMTHAKNLDLVGRVVEIDGAIVAYTFGYALNDNTFCVCLEIADHQKTGAAAFIFNRFSQDDAVKSFKWINTMDDFGMPNVARAKSAYHPVQLLPIYNIKDKHGH